MAAGEVEGRGATPRRQLTDGVVFRQPPRPPPRAWALAAARVEAGGAKYPSGRPVPPLPASPPRPPMSQAPWYRPPAAAQWRGRRWPRSRTIPPPGRGVSGEEKTNRELPGPRVGVRGIGLFKKKPGQAVKVTPDLNTLNYWSTN